MTKKKALSNTSFQRLPHFHLKGNELYFLKSRRSLKVLNTEEVQVWRFLSKSKTQIQIVSKFGSNFSTFIDELKSLGCLIEIQNPRPKARQVVIAFEPHMDDTALSVGVWLMKNVTTNLHLATVIGKYISTTYFEVGRYNLFTISEVSRLRESEAKIAAKFLNGNYYNFNYKDAPLRFNSNFKNILTMNAELFSQEYESSLSKNALRHQFKEAVTLSNQILKKYGKKNAILLAPLGIGGHPDHIWTRNAALMAFLNSKTYKALGLYVDMPYAIDHPNSLSNLTHEFKKLSFSLRFEKIKTKPFLERKKSLLSIFASQWKINNIVERMGLEHEAQEGILWIKAPKKKPNLGTLIDRLRVTGFDLFLGANPAQWIRTAEKAKRIDIFVLHDLEYLPLLFKAIKDSLPNVKVRFHLRESSTFPPSENEIKTYALETDMLGQLEITAQENHVAIISTAFRLWEDPVSVGIPKENLISMRNLGNFLELLSYHQSFQGDTDE